IVADVEVIAVGQQVLERPIPCRARAGLLAIDVEADGAAVVRAHGEVPLAVPYRLTRVGRAREGGAAPSGDIEGETPAGAGIQAVGRRDAAVGALGDEVSKRARRAVVAKPGADRDGAGGLERVVVAHLHLT